MLRHAIIGCGEVAHNHLRAVSESNLAEATYFCDIVAEKARGLQIAIPTAACCTDYREIAENPDIDSVSICTDHGSHFEIALACIENDKHVIIEKPVCINDDHAELLLQAEDAHPDIVVSVVSQHRFDPLVSGIHEAVVDGSLGRLISLSGFVQCQRTEAYYSDWHGRLATEGGSALITQGIHTLDLMLWMAGEVKSVCGAANQAKFFGNETEDNICAAIEFSNGALGTLNCTTASKVQWDCVIDLVGLEGSLRFTVNFPNMLQFVCLSERPEVEEHLESIARRRHEPALGRNYYGNSHKGQLSNFFGAIVGTEELRVTLGEGVTTLGVINRIYGAAKRGMNDYGDRNRDVCGRRG